MIRGLAAVGVMVALPVAVGAAPAPEPVAMVCLTTGTAFLQPTGGAEPRSLQLLDRLSPGSVISTEQSTQVVVAYFTGERFEVGERTLATIGPTEITTTRGSLRRLGGVPTMAGIAPIARREGLANRPGAVRLRSAEVASVWMYPRDGVAVLRSRTVLQLRGEPGTGDYSVAIEDTMGNRVWMTQARAGAVAVPSNALKPGTTYFWRVRLLGQEPSRSSPEEMFTTVAAADEKAYLELDHSLLDSDDPSLEVLRAGVAHSLGLWQEACSAIERAGRVGADVAAIDTRYDCAGLARP